MQRLDRSYRTSRMAHHAAKFRNLYPLLAGILVLLVVGCGATASTQAPTPLPPTSTPMPPTPTSFPPAVTGESKPSGIVRVEIQDETVARYLVREQLARLEFPNDAVGETSEVVGLIMFNSDGEIDSDASKIIVDLRTLRSDKDRRDRFIRTRSLESDVFPTAEFVVKELPGLEWPLPKDGEASFQIVGDMSVHGFTRPIIWEATAQFSEDSFSGIATTSFTFDEFDIAVPRVRLVLSVEETMRFELDFLASITSE